MIAEEKLIYIDMGNHIKEIVENIVFWIRFHGYMTLQQH